MTDLPRLMFAAPASGSGKTSVTCAFLRLLARRGAAPCAFKCGPDYIDPMFHRSVLGVDSWNLDLFFSTESQVRELMLRHGGGHGTAVLEGVMGYYDGIAHTTKASSWHLARATRTPVILVVRPKGSSLTLCAELRGLLDFRRPSRIEGVLLNCCSKKQFDFLAPMLEREAGVPVYGYLPVLEECGFSSRHLGLVTPADMEHVTEKIDRLADQMERTVDIQRLLALAHRAPCLEEAACETPGRRPASVRIGIARDPALCFYYEDNLSMLEQAGAELVPFSPMADRALPDGLCGLYLGGGYPEEHARALSENSGMLEEIFRRAHDGMPILAECGGFLYLQRSLADREGNNWPMAGVLDGSGFRPEKQDRFGYITMSPTEDTSYLRAGESISAHEFHRWDVSDCGSACLAQKPYSERKWPCMIAQGNIFVGFPHLYFPSCPQFPHRFVEACIHYKERMSCPKRD